LTGALPERLWRRLLADDAGTIKSDAPPCRKEKRPGPAFSRLRQLAGRHADTNETSAEKHRKQGGPTRHPL